MIIAKVSHLSSGVAMEEQLSSGLRDAPASIYALVPLKARSRQIRVLDVTSILEDSSNKCLHGILRVVNLDDKPAFAALSYVWGTYGVARKTIQLEGVKKELTDNCWSALWHLVKQLGSFTIWVDAICINQDDDSERAAQVSLMKDIYSVARPTYIWLGEGTARSDAAMEYLAVGGLQEFFSRAVTWDHDQRRFSLLIRKRTLLLLAYRALRQTVFAMWEASLPKICK